MSPSANVQSVQLLENLKTRLSQYYIEANQILRCIDNEINNSEEWLQQRLTYWRNEVVRRQETLRQADASFARCRAAGYRDPKTGAIYNPPCTAELHAVEVARSQLQQAQTEVATVQHWIGLFKSEATNYHSQSVRMKNSINDKIPQANSFLQSKINELNEYLKATLGSSAAASSSNVGGLEQGRISTYAETGAGKDGFCIVPIDQIDASDSPVSTVADFDKISAQDMKDGLEKLEKVVMPAVAKGADGDYFYDLDLSLGNDPSHGYYNIYNVFYGNSSIVLGKVGNHYSVVNGYHRIYIAQQLGITNLPVRIV